MNSGSTLFLIDAVAVALFWPMLLLFACAGGSCFSPAANAAAALIYPLTNLVSLYAMGLYRRDIMFDTEKSLARVPVAVGLGGVGALVVIYLAGAWTGQPPNAFGLFAAALIGFSLAGSAARLTFSALKHGAMFRRRVMVVGAGAHAWDLAFMLRNEGAAATYDLTFIHHDTFGAIDPRIEAENVGRVVRAATSAILPIARQIDADQIVVAPDERRGMQLDGLIQCKTAGYPVLQYMAFLETEIRRVDIKRVQLSWLLYSDGFYFGAIDRALKRMLDIAVSLLILVFASPILLAAAIAIKLDDRGPIIYSQVRITRHNRPFPIHKLRTMRIDAEAAGAVWAAASDPRITRIGKFLRQTRIDELPQLINVLSGAMSLVGPRPERPAFVEKLAAALPLYNERHMVKAGLTGWAQINYPYGASIDDARSKLSYDLFYVKNFSILFDLRIILQTLRVVLWPSGVR